MINKVKSVHRILMLNYEFPPLGGGSANATYYLLQEFAKYPDLKIDLVTSSTGKPSIEQYTDNINVHYLDINKDEKNLHFQTIKDLITYSYKAYFYCLGLKRQRHFDLCHAFFGIPCGFIAMRLGLPYIVSLRGSDVPYYNKRFYWLDKLMFSHLSKNIWKRAINVIANSEGLKKLAKRSCPDQHISVIYNGVNTGEFYPFPDKDIHHKLRLISTGRLIERKGYAYLIDALKGLENVRLTLIGDGNKKEQLVSLAKKNEVKVEFIGVVEHKRIAKYLREADLFVLPSLNEGMSNAVLEAMACGLPVIVTDTGGAQELVRGNGIIVDKADVGSLERAVLYMLKNRGKMQEMAIRSRKMAEEKSWHRVAEQYYDVYKNYFKF